MKGNILAKFIFLLMVFLIVIFFGNYLEEHFSLLTSESNQNRYYQGLIRINDYQDILAISDSQKN